MSMETLKTAFTKQIGGKIYWHESKAEGRKEFAPPIFFYHTPKSGGTSLYSSIHAAYRFFFIIKAMTPN